MATHDKQLWQGLSAEAQKALVLRDYASSSFASRLTTVGLEAGTLASIDPATAEARDVWIPGR